MPPVPAYKKNVSKKVSKHAPALRNGPVNSHFAITAPKGTQGQVDRARNLFTNYLSEINLTWSDLNEMWEKMKQTELAGKKILRPNLYDILEGFVKFLYNSTSALAKNEDKVLSQGTADNYFSQVQCIYFSLLQCMCTM
jgi:hypothetical protein